MIERVVVRPSAKRDIREARKWYRKISSDLSDDFVASLDEAIDLAQTYPLAFHQVHRTFRRVLLRRFPYALFYHLGENRITVVAVLHQARDPELLRER
jgi:toxin ParE1/3/4